MTDPTPPPAQDSLDLLLQEVPMLASWMYQALLTPMEYLQAGRSLEGEAVQESLQEVKEYLIALPPMLQEWEEKLGQLKHHPTPPQPLKQIIRALQREWDLWQEFQSHVEQLVRRLEMVAKEKRGSRLGKLPLQDTWEEIQRMALGKAQSDPS